MPTRTLSGQRRVDGPTEALGSGCITSEGGELSEEACAVALAGGAIALGVMPTAGS